MSENNRGLRALLTLPDGYISLQRLMGTNKLFGTLVTQYIQPKPGMRILDIGCGTGTLNWFLPPDVSYHGFDMNPKYVAHAQRVFAKRSDCHFFCQKVSDIPLDQRDPYDVIVAIGLIHHLDDPEARYLFELAKSRLKPGGQIVTVDCCLTQNQSPLAAFLVKRDRGQNVRSPERYKQLAEQVFSDVAMTVRHDLLHIPYTHTVLQIQSGAQTPSEAGVAATLAKRALLQ